MKSTKELKTIYRGDLFRHLDGLVVAPIAYSLHSSGLTSYILEKGELTLADLGKHSNANIGYLNVALRALSSQGWLDYQVDNSSEVVTIKVNSKTAEAFSLLHLYKDVVDLLKFSGNYHPRKFEIEPFQKLERIYSKYLDHYGLDSNEVENADSISHQILKHIEGHLVAPTTVLLGMGKMFHKYFMETAFSPDEYHDDPQSFQKILNFLSSLGWFVKKDNLYRFSDKGLFFAKRASAYGVTVSYLPTFRHLDDLIFGNANVLWEQNSLGGEKHVDRKMNVWGSGGAHASYFKKIDEIVIDIFNRPIEDQPKGILDMGCGNGAFLIHLFDVIENRTSRGEMLEEHPLFLVGVDYNEAALQVTRKNLLEADVWAKVIWGDIGDPQKLNNKLVDDYNINLEDLLNVRTFLDHNRPWSTPENQPTLESKSTGAFCSKGSLLTNNLVLQNLVEHFGKWKPFVSKNGLILIELHTVSPDNVKNALGKTAATAYDATHGFSDQYILEIEDFNTALQSVGLSNDNKYYCKFPNSDLATVSINYINKS